MTLSDIDHIKQVLFRVELSLRGIPEELDAASLQTVEAFLDGVFTDARRMHDILIPLRRAFSALMDAHGQIERLAVAMDVELHQGPEVSLKVLGPDATLAQEQLDKFGGRNEESLE